METEPIAVAVVQTSGRYLIGQRPPGKPLAGKWEFPGGKILLGETPEAAAKRECLEETGLEVLVVAPFPEVVHQYDHGAVRLHFFSCSPIDPASEPRDPFRWVEAAELGDYEFPEANQSLVMFLLNNNNNNNSSSSSSKKKKTGISE